jgi:hypothetical protein
MDHKYGVKYKLDAGSFSKEELEKDGAGGCDALVLCSIVREGNDPHEGGISFAIFSVDGRNGGPLNQAPSVPDTQLFEVWLSMAHVVSETLVPAWQQELAESVVKAARSLLAKQPKETLQ